MSRKSGSSSRLAVAPPAPAVTRAARVVVRLTPAGQAVAVAESLTGGLLAARIVGLSPVGDRTRVRDATVDAALALLLG